MFQNGKSKHWRECWRWSVDSWLNYFNALILKNLLKVDKFVTCKATNVDIVNYNTFRYLLGRNDIFLRSTLRFLRAFIFFIGCYLFRFCSSIFFVRNISATWRIHTSIKTKVWYSVKCRFKPRQLDICSICIECIRFRSLAGARDWLSQVTWWSRDCVGFAHLSSKMVCMLVRGDNKKKVRLENLQWCSFNVSIYV